jgi:hypothetical protein
VAGVVAVEQVAAEGEQLAAVFRDPVVSSQILR